jgi:hypothetical protein
MATWVPTTGTPTSPTKIVPAEEVLTPIPLYRGDSLEVELDGILLIGYDWVGDGSTTGLDFANCVATCKNSNATVIPLTLILEGMNYGATEKYRGELKIKLVASSAATASAPLGTFKYDVQLVFFEQIGGAKITIIARKGSLNIQQRISQ